MIQPVVFTRRESLGLCALLGLLAACARGGSRCGYCGMVIDPTSAWNAELVRTDGSKVEYDSPRCALLAWRTGRVDAVEIRVEEYYERTWQKGSDVVFVASSDIAGPMGADLVPVDPARARQFVREHTGTRPLPLSEITLELLREVH